MAVAHRVHNCLHILPELSIRLPHLAFAESSFVSHHVIQFASRHELQHEGDRAFVFEDIVDVDYVRVVKSHQHIDLVLGFQPLILVYFNCELLAS